MTTPFETFQRRLHSGPLPEALTGLADDLIAGQRFHELFELRKVQLRLELGLPVDQWQPIEDLPADLGAALESGLLDICREIGTLLVRAGDLAGGWSYLEPVGDKNLTRELLAEIPVNGENAETIVHIGINAGVDPGRGFEVVLDRFGTCSSITTMETQLAGSSLEVRRLTTEMLVRHVYRELLENIRQSIDGDGADQGAEPGSLKQLIEARPELTEGLNHQIDTTHLASTVRFSRILLEPEALQQAIELAEYGSRLHPDFRYEGSEPFRETYQDTLAFLQVLAGTADPQPVLDRLAGLARRQKQEAGVLDSAAWYVYLLDRLGQGEVAIDAWLELLHQVDDNDVLNEEIAPSLQQLVRRYAHYSRAAEVLRERGDLLGFATVAAARHQADSRG